MGRLQNPLRRTNAPRVNVVGVWDNLLILPQESLLLKQRILPSMDNVFRSQSSVPFGAARQMQVPLDSGLVITTAIDLTQRSRKLPLSSILLCPAAIDTRSPFNLMARSPIRPYPVCVAR